MSATVLPLRFQVGARTLAALPRRLERVALSLDDVLADRCPALPPLDRTGDGYLVTSLPESQLAAPAAATGFARHLRQRYTRYHLDLTLGVDGWLASLSANTRAGLKRKAKRLAAASGGSLDIRRCHTPDAFAAFHPLARAVSATTYQERLLDSGLPDDPRAVAHLSALAAADRLRAWLLLVEGQPVAYLCCTAEGDTLRYDYVGHDPAMNALSPGAVLQAEALRDLLAERRFARFDFTEGEGQHKRTLATGGTPCVDLLLLRPTLVNRLALAALGGFDAAVAAAKRTATHPALSRLSKRMRR